MLGVVQVQRKRALGVCARFRRLAQAQKHGRKIVSTETRSGARRDASAKLALGAGKVARQKKRAALERARLRLLEGSSTPSSCRARGGAVSSTMHAACTSSGEPPAVRHSRRRAHSASRYSRHSSFALR